MLAGPDASATSDTTLRVVGHTDYTDDAKVTHMGLVTVIRTTGNVDFNVIVAGEDDGLNFPGQLKSVAIAADAVVVADAGSDIRAPIVGYPSPGSQGWGSWAMAFISTLHSCASTSLMYVSRYSLTAGIFS